MLHFLITLTVLTSFFAHNVRADTAQEHEAAVLDARQGKLDEALRALERLDTSSSDSRVQHDLIVVYGWAGRHQQAVQVWGRMGWKLDLPEYVRRDLALSLNILASEAEGRGERFEALRYLGQALRLAFDGEKVRALRTSAERSEAAVVRLMGELGGHQGAVWRSTSPSLQQRSDRAALRLRLAKHLDDGAGTSRNERIDKVISELSELISEVRLSMGSNKVLLHQLLGDRAVAYAERKLWNQVLEDVEATAGLGLPLWPHVQMAQGAALLGLQNPVTARPVYQAVLAAQPNDLEASWGLFYALADQGKLEAATAVMDAIAPQRWRPVGLETRTTQDPDWLPARMASARVRSWNEQHDAAWQRLSGLRDIAPDDAGIRLAQASVAAARGWPRLAEQEVRSAHTLDEVSSDVQLALAESAMRRHQWAELRLRLDMLDGVENNQRTRLERDSKLKLGWRALAGQYWRTEPGSAGQSPSESRSTTTRLDAPLSINGWRPFFTAESIRGNTPSVFDAARRRGGLGMQYQGPDAGVEFTAIQETGNRPGPSLSFSARHAFNDQWSIAAGGAQRSADAPLRASANGIDVHTAHMGFDYSRDEAFAAFMGGQTYKFSDGNQRLSGSASLSQQLYASSVWRISMRQEIYASRNSSNAGPYFSPLSDLSLSLSLISQRVWLRTPTSNWSDRLELQAGKYHQQGYSDKTVNTVSYEQTFNPSPALELSCGLTFSLRYYDGAPQRATAGHLRMVTRF